MSQVPCLHEHLANAVRVKYPAALLRVKLDTPSACCGVFDFAFVEMFIDFSEHIDYNHFAIK